MHSHIIQIYTKPIDDKHLLKEDSLDLYGTPYIEYCYEIGIETRESVITNLVERWLPAGLFSLGEEKDTIVYNGGAETWTRCEWIPKIRKKADRLNAQNIFQATDLYFLRKLLDDAFDLGTLFYLTDDSCQYYAERSTALLEFVSRLEKGTILYVGGVIGYHW